MKLRDDLVDEWHPTKNLPLTSTSSLHIKKKYWWLGKCGHEWEALLDGRFRGAGCPVCAGKIILAGFNDLASKNFVIASEWHSTKNGDLKPTEVTAGSRIMVWWLGECGHEWEASVSNRVNGRGCPICVGKQVLAGFNDLTTTHPALAAEWHPIKNHITPLEIVGGSSKKYWWLGNCKHEWEASPNNRIKGRGCPFCSGRKILVGFNDFSTTHPRLAVEWHPTKNEVSPQDVTAGMEIKVWWLADCGHEWYSAVCNRAKGNPCPVCPRKISIVAMNLSITHPMIAAEWHPTKNGELTQNHVTPNSNRNVWWICTESHEWQAIIGSRTRLGHGCPYCSGHRVFVGFNDLATTHPALAAEWHPTRNGELTAEQVSAGSGRKVWWLGGCDHEWQDSIGHRTGRRGGCSVCAGQKVLVGFNDLAATHPALAAEWHPTRNGELTAEHFTAGSSKGKIWWKGAACGHEWTAILASRAKGGVGCPYCANKKVLVGFNDLATTHPALAAEWHPTKNRELMADQVIAGSIQKVWWRGVACGHEWETSLGTRAAGAGCPICSNQGVCVGFNDLASQNPVLAAEWHPTKNGELTAEHFTPKSGQKVWWRSKDCGHEWETTIGGRASGAGCPVCAGQQILIGFNDLASQNPALAAEWHPTRNGELTAKQVTVGTGQKVWWKSIDCGHEWETAIVNRSGGSGCLVCAGQQILIGYNDLATTHPALAAEWHPTKNGELTAEQVIAGSNRKFWWLGTCGHDWEALLPHRTRGYLCPYCTNKRVLCGFNDLATTNPILAAEWHPTKNGELTSKEVTAGSGRRIWWLGNVCGHEWDAVLSSRSTGKGCPHCYIRVSKAEEQIKNFLEGLGLVVEQSNRTVLNGKEIDLWIPEKQIAIEFNGIYWHSEKYRGQDFHYDKWQECKNQGIQLIQIWEDGWNSRPEIIMRTLAHKLGVNRTGSVVTDSKVISITEQQAEEFLNENHLQGFATGSYYLGLVEVGEIEKLQAVMALDESTPESESLGIIRFVSIANVSENFNRLLSCAMTAYSPESISAIADHCEADEELYANNGFIAERELPPNYMYVIRTERKPRSEYPLERFRSDPKLLWEEGLTETELADLNGLDRIWDAGKTLYRLFV